MNGNVLVQSKVQKEEQKPEIKHQRRVKPHTFHPSATFEDMVIHKLNIMFIGRLFLIKKIKNILCQI